MWYFCAPDEMWLIRAIPNASGAISVNGNYLEKEARSFRKHLEQLKNSIDGSFSWYPYGSMNNFYPLRNLFNARPLDTLVSRKAAKILDIGAADGDVAFFLEHLGFNVDIIDNGPTDLNGLEGARLLRKAMGSKVGIYEIDLDAQFSTPDERYEVIFFLGILYHLKNPFFVLEELCRISKYLVLSTRVARFTPDQTPMRANPLAYLLAPTECNNDPTNYWIFSEAGLERIANRCGWDILEMQTVGDTLHSNPADQDHDERAFALLRSRVWELHNDIS